MVHGLSCSAACGIFPARLEPVSPALAGGFLITAPSGKSKIGEFLCSHFNIEDGRKKATFSAYYALLFQER